MDDNKEEKPAFGITHRRWIIITSIVFLTGILIACGAYLYHAALFAENIETIDVHIEDGQDRTEIADSVGTKLNWGSSEREEFIEALTLMQWGKLGDTVRDILMEDHDWGSAEEETFDDQVMPIRGGEYDVLHMLYEADLYTFSEKIEPQQAALQIVDRTEKDPSYIRNRLDGDRSDALAEFVASGTLLLPDIVPLPPFDIGIEERNERDLLVFSTTYYNQGDGPLELVADEETRHEEGDVDRRIYQRIHLSDGGHEEHYAGTFLWHEPHLHYHFTDFIDYSIEPVNVDGDNSVDGEREKATFCVRDVTRVELELDRRAEEADFTDCGRERQGVSVGWGDTYFYDYPDQFLDVTDLPEGEYELTFVVNPEGRFAEISRDNNKSSAHIEITPERTVEVIDTYPDTFPQVDHVYEEDAY